MMDRPETSSARARRPAALVALAFAIGSSVATSPPPQPTARAVSAPSTLRLDADARFAAQRFVVAIPAPSVPNLLSTHAEVVVEDIRAVDDAGRQIDGSGVVDLRVVSTVPTRDSRGSPLPRNDASGARTAPLDAVDGASVALPMTCRAPGPCERAFRLIATLRSAARVEVRWHAAAKMSYSGSAYPSGAVAEFRVDPQEAIAAAAPRLDVATPPQVVELSATRPAAARLVELRVDPAALPSDNTGLDAVIEATIARQGPADRRARDAEINVYAIPASEDQEELLPWPRPGEVVSSLRQPTLAACFPGQECVLQLLVTIAWVAGEPADYQWSVVVRRLDIERATETPDAIGLRVLEAIDPVGPPDAAHYAGETVTYRPGDTRTPPSFRFTTAIADSTGSPEPFERLLPLPGVARFHAERVDGQPLGSVRLRVPYAGGDLAEPFGFVSQPPAEINSEANIFATCRVGEECPHVSLSVSGGEEAVAVRWTLDVQLYSYPDVPLILRASQD